MKKNTEIQEFAGFVRRLELIKQFEKTTDLIDAYAEYAEIGTIEEFKALKLEKERKGGEA